MSTLVNVAVMQYRKWQYQGLGAQLDDSIYTERPPTSRLHTPQSVMIPQHEENPLVSCSSGTCSGESLVPFHQRFQTISYIICYTLALRLIESRM